jgi:DNA-directed RNA polymerase
VQQRYRKTENVAYKMPKWDRKSQLLRLSDLELQTVVNTPEIDKKKSVTAAAPNFIHSLDATLLMKAVLLCKKHSVTDLMVVHDSFSTTIGNAQTMSVAIREAFLDLFGNHDPYVELLNQTATRLSAFLPQEEGELLDLTEILRSQYAFS